MAVDGIVLLDSDPIVLRFNGFLLDNIRNASRSHSYLAAGKRTDYEVLARSLVSVDELAADLTAGRHDKDVSAGNRRSNRR